MIRFIKLLVLLGTAIFGVSLALLNPELTRLDLFLLQLNIPLSLVVALSIVLGILIGALTLTLFWYTEHRRNRRLDRQLSLLKEEVRNLRIAPVKDALSS